MSYFFVTTLQVFFCIALLSGVLWSRNDPPSLRPLTWTLLTGLIAGVLAGLFIHGSQPVQLLLVGAEVMVSLLFVLSFWWASTRIRYLWQGILIFGAARHWALDPNLGGLTSTHVLNTDLLLNLTAVVLAFAILCLAGVLCAMLLRRIRGLYWPRAHFSAVTVHGIEQYPCFVIIVIRFGCHKCPAVVQGIQIPDTTAVVFAKTVHPAEDTGLQGHPLWNEAKMLRPEADALFIRDEAGRSTGGMRRRRPRERACAT